MIEIHILSPLPSVNAHMRIGVFSLSGEDQITDSTKALGNRDEPVLPPFGGVFSTSMYIVLVKYINVGTVYLWGTAKIKLIFSPT